MRVASFFWQAFKCPPVDERHRSPSVLELKSAEKVCLKQAMRLEITTGCSFGDALAEVIKEGRPGKLLQEKPKETEPE